MLAGVGNVFRAELWSVLWADLVALLDAELLGRNLYWCPSCQAG